MGSLVIACSTIRDELGDAIGKTGVSHPVIWIESGLHDNPDALRARLQEEINRVGNVDRIILGFGYCGNALLGLSCPSSGLVFPMVDDCISLLLGSQALRQQLSRETGTYYLTRGWLEYENNIYREYERCLKRYGAERAGRILRIMLEHYKRLLIIDTGAYPLNGFLEKVRGLADSLDLAMEVVAGSSVLLEKLVTGPWDADFCVLEAGGTVSMECLGLSGINGCTNTQFLNFR